MEEERKDYERNSAGGSFYELQVGAGRQERILCRGHRESVTSRTELGENKSEARAWPNRCGIFQNPQVGLSRKLNGKMSVRISPSKGKGICDRGTRGMEKRSLRSRIEKWEISKGMVKRRV